MTVTAMRTVGSGTMGWLYIPDTTIFAIGIKVEKEAG
jgi:hypothetical protein